MSPEQAAGLVHKLDRRSDVFGLGAVLAVVLTGKPPFAAASAETVRGMADLGDLADCFARLDGCGADPELVALCKRCLSPRLDDRPVDGGAVGAAVAAWRATVDERARRQAEQRMRRRLTRTAGVVMALTVAGGLGGVVLVQGRANAQLERKNQELLTQQTELFRRSQFAGVTSFRAARR